MSPPAWRSTKASRVFAALQRIGWTVKREGFPNYVWSFHDRDDIAPRMLARIAKRTGLEPEDL